MRKILEMIRERGVTVLLAEQNVKRALDVSDRAYVLVGERIVHSRSSKERRRRDSNASSFGR